MSDNHTTYKAEEVVNNISNFEIYPFTVDTGCPLSDVKEPHLHDFYVVHYVTRGRGTCVIDFESYDIMSDSLYFVSPGQLHMWQPEEGLEGFVMLFTEEFITGPEATVSSVFELEFFNSVAHSPMFMLTRRQGTEISGLMSQLNHEFRAEKTGYVTVLRSFFHILMVNMQRMFADKLHDKSMPVENSLVREFKKLVSKTYASQLRVQDYAEMMNVSVSRLNSVIKDVTTRTPGQIVRGEMITVAKRMLAHSDLNISEICFELKFEDPSYFGRFFKRETGFTPSVFREQVRGKYHHLAR